jgi:hypothetical protein
LTLTPRNSRTGASMGALALGEAEDHQGQD